MIEEKQISLTMTTDEARLLLRAAIAGLKGSRPVEQQKDIADALLTKVARLADQLI